MARDERATGKPSCHTHFPVGTKSSSRSPRCTAHRIRSAFDLPQPREREVVVHAQLWGWITEDDRQVLLGAGFGPSDLAALLER